MKLRIAKFLSIGFFLPCLIWAQEDEPGRGVARVSLINGDVSIRRSDSGDWVAAAPNSPLVAADQVLTGPGSRAEVQFDYANFLRLSSDTEIRIAQLENRRYQIQVARGTVMVDVLRESEADFEVDTPNVSVRPVKRGMYRITVTPDGDSEITVREGEAEAFTPRGTERLRSGRTMLVRGSADSPDYQMVRAPDRDEWDRWNDERDKRLERSNAYQYVSRDIYGADDLDGYGRWVNVPPYGWVWSPSGVAVDWAPYRYGRWGWVDYYGWTWISSDPWGWAPYHYGRWFYGAPYGWCWYPGPRHNRYYWRPALVGFFGYGGRGVNIGVGFGFGNVGWVPLAPYETFHPWYGRRYYGGYRNPTLVNNNITVINNTNIVNVYRNARGGRGVSGIGADDFVRGRSPRSLRMTDGDWQRASLVRGQIPVTPRAESLRMSDRMVRTPVRANMETTRFYSRRPAPAVERVSFEDQRRGMERAVTRTFGPPARQGNRETAAGGGRSEGPRPSPAAGARSGSEGWRNVGERRNEPAAASRAGEIGSHAREATPVERERGNANWNRFPNAGGATPRNEQPRVERETSRPEPRVERERGNANWNRFPSAGAQTPRNETREERETPRPQPRSSGNWDRFPNSQSSPERTAPRVERAPDTGREMRQQRFEPRSESPRFDRSESIRINPPIVRERSQPRFEGSGGSPRMSSGGGGGSPRVSGGGGGGARSESRGGGRSGGGGGGGRRR